MSAPRVTGGEIAGFQALLVFPPSGSAAVFTWLPQPESATPSPDILWQLFASFGGKVPILGKGSSHQAGVCLCTHPSLPPPWSGLPGRCLPHRQCVVAHGPQRGKSPQPIS